MKKTIRITSAILAVLTVLALFAGCAKKDPETPSGMKKASGDEADYIMYVPEDWRVDSSSLYTAAFYSSEDATSISATAYGTNYGNTSVDDWFKGFMEKMGVYWAICFGNHEARAEKEYHKYFMLKNIGRLKAFALGTYKVSFGMGLVVANGYSFGKDFVMKGAMYLTEDLPIQYKLSSFTKTNLELIEDHWEDTKTAIRRSIELVSRFGFSDSNLVTKLAQYLRNKKLPKYIDSSNAADVKDQSNIQKWLILVTLRNLLGSSTDTTLNKMRKIIGDRKDAFPYQELLREFLISPKFSDEEIDNYLSYKYSTRYSYLVLSMLYPSRDWKDRKFQEDHIFPQSLLQRKPLKSMGFDDETIERYLALRDTICNLELLDDSENNDKRAKEFDIWVTSRDALFKERHMIPEMDSYAFSEFEKFISARKELLREQIRSFGFEE